MKHLEDEYTVVQHKLPKLIGSSNMASHHVSYAVGYSSIVVSEGICNTSETILYFFKSYFPSVIDGRIGKYYSYIVEHCVEKVILYMGHVVRCKAQEDRIKEIHAQSKGKTLIITIDYRLKYEETRARESSREHYTKKDIVVHRYRSQLIYL